MEEEFKNRIDLAPLKTYVGRIEEEISKVIIGQEQMVDLLITAVLARGHVLLEGVPGVAKTLTSKLVAKTIDARFSRIQFTPDLMPSDIIGTSVFNPKTTEFNFRQGPLFSNLVLIDEINRSPAKTQAALFEVMEERQVTADGTTYIMDEPYMVLATQNPIEQEGTYRLPEAQLDRFLFKIVIGYPGLDEEVQILQNSTQGGHKQQVDLVQKVLSKEEIAVAQKLVTQIHVEDKVVRYIAQ
ncbi:MAG: AAA family ATPase, partial [Cyclobacteriaceae bacterium]